MWKRHAVFFVASSLAEHLVLALLQYVLTVAHLSHEQPP